LRALSASSTVWKPKWVWAMVLARMGCCGVPAIQC
jgi:hypothetical protein